MGERMSGIEKSWSRNFEKSMKILRRASFIITYLQVFIKFLREENEFEISNVRRLERKYSLWRQR